MKPVSCSFALALLMLAPLARAAAPERPGDSAAQPAMLAAADVPVSVVRLSTTGVDAQPLSAGVVTTLPEQPTPQGVAFDWTSRIPLPVATADTIAPPALPQDAEVSTLDASPLRVAAHLVRAERFNTDDGVRVDDFAICYRLNRRSSIQVIPGDPAPVKMPVSSMANNTGVTVGMVMRLSKRP